MAILQLSRITNRKGLEENLPQLAAAEFGWAIDQRRLYIGNGTLIEGAPTIGNTELLTEHSDILGLSSSYTYKGSAAGYVVVTGDGTDVVRSLQSKFDDFVSVKDFGAKGDGTTDDTAAINRALFELFCRGGNSARKRSLYFPAGIYRVTGIIKVPPHAKLWGEGLTSSIIQFEAADPILASTMTVGVQYAISDFTGTTPAEWVTAGAPSGTANDEIFVAIAPAVGTGTVREVPMQVVETSDSLHQTGINIGTNSAETPTGIEMSAMGIYSNEDHTLLKLDSVTNSGFSYLSLHGPNTDPTIEIGTSAIEIATSVAPTNNVTISKLDTHGTTYGLKAAGDAKGVVLETSGLDFHYKGVYITNPLISATLIVIGTRYKIVDVGTTDFVTEQGATYNREGVTFTATAAGTGAGTVISMDEPGPTGVVVSRNIFDNIANAGIHFENTLFNSSGFNVFYDVANAAPGIPVIIMDTDQCVSVGDLFEREDETSAPRVALLGNGGIYIDGSHSIHLGAYERQAGLQAALPAAGSGELFLNTTSDPNSYKIDYNISNTSATRRGTMTVSVFNGTVTYNDEYTETGTIAVTLSAVAGANSDSTFEFSSAGIAATINFSVVRLD